MLFRMTTFLFFSLMSFPLFCQGKIFELFEEFPKEAFIAGKWQAAWWSPLPEKIQKRVKGISWKENCPVPLEDLAYVIVSHYNEKGVVQRGELVYHKNLAPEIIEIFKELFEEKFPIQKMKLIDDFAADDIRSMEANNTSAFCSRENTTRPGVFSKHSYGGTIDINPLINPYVNGERVLPEQGRGFLNREQGTPGMIVEGDVCCRAFKKRGYTWGGNWTDRIDFQHFEKDPKSFVEQGKNS